jgi:hypothetical protein
VGFKHSKIKITTAIATHLILINLRTTFIIILPLFNLKIDKMESVPPISFKFNVRIANFNLDNQSHHQTVVTVIIRLCKNK